MRTHSDRVLALREAAPAPMLLSFGKRRWLRKPNRALQGRRPLDLAASDVGFRVVERLLGRIEQRGCCSGLHVFGSGSVSTSRGGDVERLRFARHRSRDPPREWIPHDTSGPTFPRVRTRQLGLGAGIPPAAEPDAGGLPRVVDAGRARLRQPVGARAPRGRSRRPKAVAAGRGRPLLGASARPGPLRRGPPRRSGRARSPAR